MVLVSELTGMRLQGVIIVKAKSKSIPSLLKVQFQLQLALLQVTWVIMPLTLVISSFGALVGGGGLFDISVKLFGVASGCHLIGAGCLVYEAVKGTNNSGVDFTDFKCTGIVYVSAIVFDLMYSFLMFFIFYYIPVFFGFVTYKADVSIIYSVMLVLWVMIVLASLFRTYKWCKGNEAIVGRISS